MKEKRDSSGIYIIVITAFFLGCFLLLIVFGTNIYRSVAQSQADNNNKRAVLSYLLTISRMNETDIYAATDQEKGSVLVVEDAGTGFGSRIYVHEGNLVEDYGKLGGSLSPDYATAIGKTDVFEIEQKDSDLMKINTDQGSVFIHTRSAGE